MIAFFGGSVTQQRNGYVDLFRKLSGQKVKKFGYGGMHLSNAGICFLHDVSQARPSVCYVDWFSTAFNETSDAAIEYINTIYCKLSSTGCRVIFLFLPYLGDSRKEIFYDFVKGYLAREKLEFLALDETLDIKKHPGILRDEIHTSPHGSLKYAELIFRHYDAAPSPFPDGPSGDGSKYVLDAPCGHNRVKAEKYADIKSLEVDAQFNTRVVLEGQCEIIGFLIVVGKHSGIINVRSSNGLVQFNTWDKWCHFPREHFYMNLAISGECELLISQAPFDTSECKAPVDFSSINKKLIIKNIYYTGERLRITNGSEGRAIPHSKIWFDKFRARLNQKLRMLTN